MVAEIEGSTHCTGCQPAQVLCAAAGATVGVVQGLRRAVAQDGDALCSHLREVIRHHVRSTGNMMGPVNASTVVSVDEALRSTYYWLGALAGEELGRAARFFLCFFLEGGGAPGRRESFAGPHRLPPGLLLQQHVHVCADPSSCKWALELHSPCMPCQARGPHFVATPPLKHTTPPKNRHLHRVASGPRPAVLGGGGGRGHQELDHGACMHCRGETWEKALRRWGGSRRGACGCGHVRVEEPRPHARRPALSVARRLRFAWGWSRAWSSPRQGRRACHHGVAAAGLAHPVPGRGFGAAAFAVAPARGVFAPTDPKTPAVSAAECSR